MKAYRIELLVIDFDGLGPNGVRSAIENTRYANHCISPSVMAVDERDIGEWSDDNPLNKHSTAAAEFRRLFAAPADGTEKDTARLDFMIAEECQIEHVDRIGPPPFYRVRWPWEEREMRAWSATPREAIDAAIAAKEPPCGS